ncbi:hypothetical protein [Candidatus Thiodictyon syntrophicum]|jgi:hypothetical protein|uniref:Uncharacterized protein n=1 Tax=Candidatus Thiodictyon syntrophicum TaxID=1166950 RepID=A0A2K8U4I4_9GAMM|nr:hypothetical protein [Candidatus Thiodictyon syntrophicum]AUB80488.1 hypothetical protein THSYN_05690 [Candidatus Thiodictyon syntrophicum]
MTVKTVWGIIIIVLSVAAGLYGLYNLVPAVRGYFILATDKAPQFLIAPYEQAIAVSAFIVIVAVAGAIGGTIMLKKKEV